MVSSAVHGYLRYQDLTRKLGVGFTFTIIQVGTHDVSQRLAETSTRIILLFMLAGGYMSDRDGELVVKYSCRNT